MIESVRIENFRGFKRVAAEGLSTVNVIVGRNSSGKTALLEALYLTAGASPEIALRLRAWRGMGDSAQVRTNRASYEALWRDLFYQFNEKNEISIGFRGTPKGAPKGTRESTLRALRISYTRSRSVMIAADGTDDATAIIPLRFQWKGPGVETTVAPTLTADGLKLEGGIPNEAAFFATGQTFNPVDNADRYSALSQQNKELRVLEGLKSEFPFIRGLSVEVNAGVPMVFAAVDGVDVKEPIGLVSSGINKLLAILIAIASMPGGLVIVDEVENGLYHDTMGSIWRLLHRFAVDYQTQLFFSTHSLEALTHLQPVVAEHPEDFSLLRIERIRDVPTIRSFRGREFSAALEQHVEIR